jgi:hypothetical protein
MSRAAVHVSASFISLNLRFLRFYSGHNFFVLNTEFELVSFELKIHNYDGYLGSEDKPI